MGISIGLSILPDGIDNGEWEQVYQESLALVNGYPFLDKIVDWSTYRTPWVYVERTRERLIDVAHNKLGWLTVGDEASLSTGEAFVLVRDLDYYKKSGEAPPAVHDILLSLKDEDGYFTQLFREPSPAGVKVFAAETQGHPYHLHILAIACLIEARFPKQAVVTGDVSLRQMKKAVAWANTILDKPVSLTDRADGAKLYARIAAALSGEEDRLSMFLSTTLQAKDQALGDFIREKFYWETILNYFTARFRQHPVGSFGFENALKDYLHLGFGLDDACELCVLDPQGCRIDPEQFCNQVLHLNWESEKANSETVASTPSAASKFMAEIADFQEELKIKMTVDEVIPILLGKLGGQCDVEGLVARHGYTTSKLDNVVNALQQEIFEAMEQQAAGVVSFDVGNYGDLILWQKGQTIAPGVLAALAVIKGVVDENLRRGKAVTVLHTRAAERDKMKALIKANKYYYIHRRTWDFIAENINDPLIFQAMATILLIKAEEFNMRLLLKALLNNIDLLKTYVLE